MNPMKILISLFFVFSLSENLRSQETGLEMEQQDMVRRFLAAVKSKDKARISDYILYPLRRKYPLADVKNRQDFIRRFDEVFDREFIDRIAKSGMGEWEQVGWRGISFTFGDLWMTDDGKIYSINHQSEVEKRMLTAALQEDKNTLPANLRDFEEPKYLIYTKTYKIRIDRKYDNVYRYSAWTLKNPRYEPDLVIENGELENMGSGGNHRFIFKNKGYTYELWINVMKSESEPDANLEVIKSEKTLLTQGGSIRRN